MAIDFGDIAAFATGVVDADTAATQERLKDRRAELQADRQLYIDMKTKKYESELKSFEAENKKYKAIQAVKSQIGDGSSKSDFGAAYLQETNPTLLYQMQKDFQDNPAALQKQLALYANADFKTSTSRDALDTKLKTDINAITAGYKKALENAKGDSRLINAILGKRDKEIKLVVEQNKDGETGAIAAKQIATEIDTSDEAYKYGEENKIVNNYKFNKWKKDSKIQDLRKAIKDKVSSINKGTIDTTLNTLGSLNIQLPKQFLTFEQGKTSGTITGIKDKGKIVVEHITLLDNQALNFMSNEWIFGKDTEATNVSNYYSAIEAKNLTTSRVRDYSSEGTVNQQKKGFWSDRENFVGFVPFSVVGLDNDFIYKEDGSGITINSSSRKTVGSLYYQTLKKIAMANDPEFKNSTEAEAINKLQDKLLKLKEGDSSNLLTQVKNEMATSMKLNEPKVEEEALDKAPDNIVTNKVESIIVDGQTVPLTKKNIEEMETKNFDWQSVPKVKTKKTEINIQEPVALVPQETDEGYDPEYNTGLDRSVTAGTIRRLKRGNTIPMSRAERMETRRIQNDFRKKQKKLLENKKRNKELNLPEITPLNSE